MIFFGKTLGLDKRFRLGIGNIQKILLNMQKEYED